MKFAKLFLGIVSFFLLLSFTQAASDLNEYCGKYKFEQNGQTVISEVNPKNDSTLEVVSSMGAVEVVKVAQDTFEVQSFGGTVIFLRDQTKGIEGKITKAVVNIPSANLEIEAIKQD